MLLDGRQLIPKTPPEPRLVRRHPGAEAVRLANFATVQP